MSKSSIYSKFPIAHDVYRLLTLLSSADFLRSLSRNTSSEIISGMNKAMSLLLAFDLNPWSRSDVHYTALLPNTDPLEEACQRIWPFPRMMYLLVTNCCKPSGPR